MTLEQNIDEAQIENDDAGMDELNRAMQEIENLKNQDDKTDSSQEKRVEEREESSEDEHENEQEEEYDDEENEDESEDERLWRLKRDKYRYLQEKQNLARENARLQQMLHDSVSSGTYHYSKNAYTDLEKAKDNYKKAVETGDVDGLVEANISLSKAQNAVIEVEKWNNKQQRISQQQQHMQPNYADNNVSGDELYQEIATDWIQGHSYLRPDSKNYNPEIAQQVSGFINNLDGQIAQNGRQDVYFTPEYFNTIDRFIKSIRQEATKNTVRTNIESSAHIGGVRKTSSAGGAVRNGNTGQMILSADEKRMAANAGISEKEWLKYKLDDLKNKK